MNKKMKITLKDGSVKEYENNMSVIDIAKDISEDWQELPVQERLMEKLLILELSLTKIAN